MQNIKVRYNTNIAKGQHEFSFCSQLMFTFSCVCVCDFFSLVLQDEMIQQQDRLRQARQLQSTTELARQTTIDDLTHGIVNYKYLGLDFVKARDERLRYVF
jgi:hypothetical protein